jgi:hypothetical protein
MEVFHARTTLQVLETSSHGNPGPFEDPNPAYLAGLSLNRRTLAPVNHWYNLPFRSKGGKTRGVGRDRVTCWAWRQ